jgi:hypothetical protein
MALPTLTERAPAALDVTPLGSHQWRLADTSDEVVAAAVAQPIPPGHCVSSWREEKCEIGGGRRQFLFWLTDGDTGLEVLACVGVESSKYHPKFTITNQGANFAPRRPRTMLTKKRRDIIEFLDMCIGSVARLAPEGGEGATPLEGGEPAESGSEENQEAAAEEGPPADDS